MPHALSITDGTTTVSLSTYSTTAGVMLRAYTPVEPAFDAATGTYRDVTEAADIFIFDTTPANAQDKLRAIERLCYAAINRRVTRRGPRVFLQYQLSSDSYAWRSEIVDARIIPDKATAQTIPQAKIAATLAVTRAPYWEGSRTALTLNNGNGTTSSGLTIRNHNDATSGHDNFATVTSTVLGSIPAPVEFHLKNTSGAARFFGNFFASIDSWGGTNHVLEGEAASGVTVGANALCSGGQYGQRSGSGTQVWTWTISEAALASFAGRKARVIGRFLSMFYPVEYSLKTLDFSGLLQLGPPAPLYSHYTDENLLMDCGVVALPPDTTATGYGSMKLSLELYPTTSVTNQLDFVQLHPAEPGTFRHIRQRGYQLDVNEILVDDPYDGAVYSLDASNKRFGGIHVPLSEPLMITPGVANQRLIFMWDFANMDVVGVDSTLQVLAYYRPRRLTL